MMHNPGDRLFQLFKPMIWLVLFGSAGGALVSLSGIASGLNYQQFMLPGILLNTVLVTSMGYGINLKWESEIGILSRILVAPVSRLSIVVGKALSSVLSSLLESAVFLILASVIQVKFSHDVLALSVSVLVIILYSIGAASLGMIFAILLRSREAYTGVVGMVSFPSLFASNSLFSLNQMPLWLRIMARLNPVTYGVDSIRRLLIYRSLDPVPLLTDILVVLVTSLLVLAIAVVLFRRLEH